MHTRITEISTLLLLFDLILTQAIERYQEMEPNEIRKAIKTEWKDQAGVLLREFLFRGSNKRGTREFCHRTRRDGNGIYIEPRHYRKAKPFGCHR